MKSLRDHFFRVYKNDGSPRDSAGDAKRAVDSGRTMQETLMIPDEQMLNYYEYANELYEQSNYEDASHIFFLLTQLNPLARVFWLAYANAEWMNNHFEEAFSAYQMAIVLDPLNPDGYLALAKCCVANDEKQAAIEYLNLMEATCDPSEELDHAIAYKRSLEAVA